MPSVFTQIILGEIPCYKIAEDDHCLAFLDIMPLQKGHTIVVPKVEVDSLFDLSSEEYQQLMFFAKKVAEQLKRKISCRKIGMAVIGLEVPHAHIHLIPINSMDDMNFSNEKQHLASEEMRDLQERLAFELG
jgi:histidine triad (HIT) family protein